MKGKEPGSKKGSIDFESNFAMLKDLKIARSMDMGNSSVFARSLGGSMMTSSGNRTQTLKINELFDRRRGSNKRD